MKTTLYGSKDEKKRLAGLLGVSQFQEAGVSNIDFDYLQDNGLSLHQFSHLDLSVARTDAKFLVRGTYLQFLNMTSGGTLYVSFNKPKENIPFDDVEQWESPFYQIFITNTAQAGVSCDMLVMTNGRYTPYYKTKAVSPVVNSNPTIGEIVVSPVANVATLIIAASALRRQVYIQSDIANADNIFLGKAATVTVATGFPLYIGGQNQFLEPYYTGDIYGISATASQKVRIWVNYE